MITEDGHTWMKASEAACYLIVGIMIGFILAFVAEMAGL